MPKETKTPEAAAKEPESDMVEIPLSEANHAQLMWFSQQQGYETNDAETQHQTYARIKAAWDHSTITVPRVIEEDIPDPASSSPEDPDPSDREYWKKKIKIKILSVGDENKTEELLNHEGIAYRVQVGEIVSLPRDVIQSCILDAKQFRYRSDTDSGLGDPIIAQAIAFNIIEQ